MEWIGMMCIWELEKGEEKESEGVAEDKRKSERQEEWKGEQIYGKKKILLLVLEMMCLGR